MGGRRERGKRRERPYSREEGVNMDIGPEREWSVREGGYVS